MTGGRGAENKLEKERDGRRKCRMRRKMVDVNGDLCSGINNSLLASHAALTSTLNPSHVSTLLYYSA